MCMAHFGNRMEVNVFVKQFLVSFHGGFICLDRKVPIYIKLISAIMGLPLAGLGPTPFFVRKEQYIALTNKLKDKYDLSRDTKGFLIASINDHVV